MPIGTDIVPSPVHEALAGALVPHTPRWRIVRPLGEGGMGSLWEVEHVELGRRAALKVPRVHQPARTDAFARLRDEARALARVRHPGIPDVLDLGTLDDGRPYFVMERIHGGDLRAELVKHGVFAVPTALRMIVGLLDALEAVHGAGLVHRDVKLENVVVRADGRVALVDFGLALRHGDPLRRTGSGRAVGTPRNMSPEQHARAALDHRVDLYAAGLCLFELIAGHGPFDDTADTFGMFRAHCERTPPRLSDVAPQLVPPRLDEITRRALAKSPDERFEHAGEMRSALSEVETRPRLCRWYTDDSPFSETDPSPARILRPLLEPTGSGVSWDDVASSELEPV